MLSSISVVSSTNSCSIRAERICSHTSAFVHARNRLYTLCHSPNRSGRSRHGTPVFSQYGIALSISRLLFPGRPPCGFLSGGNWLLILFHCFSLISCRFMNSILLFLHFVHNTKVVEVDHHHVAARQHMIRADVDGKGRFVGFCISVFDKGIITRHLKNGANLHQTTPDRRYWGKLKAAVFARYGRSPLGAALFWLSRRPPADPGHSTRKIKLSA